MVMSVVESKDRHELLHKFCDMEANATAPIDKTKLFKRTSIANETEDEEE